MPVATLTPLLFLLLDLTPALAPATEPHVFRREGKVMGTIVTFSAFTSDEKSVEVAFQAAFEELQRIEDLMTDWERPGQAPSEIVRVNAAAGVQPVKVSDETLAVVLRSQEMSARSGGALDITFAAMHGLWKFDEDRERKVPDAGEIARRRKLIDYRALVVDKRKGTLFLRRKGMRLGLGGVAKGYAVDRAASVLRSSGLRDFMIQAGGDLYVSGRKGQTSWRVGIKDPRGEVRDRFFALASIEDRAFSTAGDYERFFVLDGRRYHHIIDPKTGYPATRCRSVTVFAKSAFEADLLDDAIFILGPARGLALVEATPDAGAVIVDAKNGVHISKRLRSVVELIARPSEGL